MLLANARRSWFPILSALVRNCLRTPTQSLITSGTKKIRPEQTCSLEITFAGAGNEALQLHHESKV